MDSGAGRHWVHLRDAASLGEAAAGRNSDDVHLPMVAFFAGYRIVMEEQAKAYDQPTRLDWSFAGKSGPRRAFTS